MDVSLHVFLSVTNYFVNFHNKPLLSLILRPYILLIRYPIDPNTKPLRDILTLPRQERKSSGTRMVEGTHVALYNHTPRKEWTDLHRTTHVTSPMTKYVHPLLLGRTGGSDWDLRVPSGRFSKKSFSPEENINFRDLNSGDSIYSYRKMDRTTTWNNWTL